MNSDKKYTVANPNKTTCVDNNKQVQPTNQSKVATDKLHINVKFTKHYIDTII